MSHMIYGSCDIECDRLLSFWTIFFLFPPLITWKIKIMKKWKKCVEISFYTSAPKLKIMMYGSWDMEHNRFFCHFRLFFALLPSPLSPKKQPKNQSLEKMKKKPGDILILQMRAINNNNTMYGSWDVEIDRQNF